MSTVFIFHGTGGHPNENWFPWMKTALEERGYRAIIPAFPNSDHPALDTWMRYMERYKDSIDEDTIFIGHSLGATLALRLLEQMQNAIQRAYLVAPVWSTLDNEFDSLNASFITQPYDWDAIRSATKETHILHADNDPYISLELTKELAKHLGTDVRIIPGGGHLNTAAGYSEFPELLSLIIGNT